MWFWFLTCIYYAISVLNWGGWGREGDKIVLVGKMYSILAL